MKLLNVASGHMYEEIETIVACTTANGELKLISLADKFTTISMQSAYVFVIEFR